MVSKYNFWEKKGGKYKHIYNYQKEKKPNSEDYKDYNYQKDNNKVKKLQVYDKKYPHVIGLLVGIMMRKVGMIITLKKAKILHRTEYMISPLGLKVILVLKIILLITYL